MSIEKYRIGKKAVGNEQLNPEAGKWVKVALGASEAAGGILAWQNPESSQIIVDRIILNITAAAAAGLIADFGVAANPTTSSDDLMDGAGLKTEYSPVDGLASGGTNGKVSKLVDEKGGTNDYITGSFNAGTIAGLAGYAYIHYRTI